MHVQRSASLFLIIISICLILFSTNLLWRKSKENKKRLKILIWPSSISAQCSGYNVVSYENCPIEKDQSCILMCDKMMYNNSDAVVFDMSHVNDFPGYRWVHQKWIAMDTEPPTQCEWPNSTVMGRIRTAFNLTSFLSFDSEIPVQSPTKCSINEAKLISQDHTSYKNGSVAWIMSKCTTQSKREQYVKELQKYIDVDIYGKCGQKTICGTYKDWLQPCSLEKINKYWFYLSFEESLCQDYVTDNLWKIITNADVVPVVYGAAKYNDILPSNTYVDAREFGTPKELAEHLRMLIANKIQYNEYLNRKKAVECNLVPEEDYGCRLCRYMHDYQYVVETVPNIQDYWSVEKRCMKPEDFIPQAQWVSLKEWYKQRGQIVRGPTT